MNLAPGALARAASRPESSFRLLILLACALGFSGTARAGVPTLRLGRSYTSGTSATVVVYVVPNGQSVDQATLHMSFSPISMRPTPIDIHPGRGWTVGSVVADGTAALWMTLNKATLGGSEGPLVYIDVPPLDLTSSGVSLLADSTVRGDGGTSYTVPSQDTLVAALPKSGISFQGQLKTPGTAGTPANGAYSFVFMLFRSPTAAEGSSVDVPIAMNNVPVTNGVFSVSLPFPASTFQNTPASLSTYYLAIGVRSTGSTTYEFLSPLQPVNPTPLAVQALGLAPGSSIEGDSSNILQVLSNSTSASAHGVSAMVLPSNASTSSTAILGANYGNGQGVSGQAQTGYAVYGLIPSVGSTASADGVRGESWATNGTGVHGIGRVGSSAYGVWGESSAGYAVYANSASGVGVYAFSGTGSAVQARGSGTLYEGANASGRVFRVDSTGKVFANGGLQGSGADVAEFIGATTLVEPGDVVEIDPVHEDQFRRCATANSTAVAGVISTRPGVTLNATAPGEKDNDAPQLAMMGRVPVKATAENGSIVPGDLLVASGTPGHAMRAPADPKPGTVIGKALSSLASGSGTVKMLVMLR